MGGVTDSLNIVKLTAKEHFICHRLLPYMVEPNRLKLKMVCALMFMAYGNGQTPKHIPASITIETIKKKLSSLKKGTKGNKWSDAQKAKLKNRKPHNKGIPMSEEAKENLRSKRAKQVIGPVAAVTKEKISKKLTGLTKGTKCWNNGLITKRQKECPGPEWILGILRNNVAGKLWWNDGTKNCRMHNSPGPSWKPGRFNPQII
jgi:hypothetical protein